jgi:two-component system chemotaxis response regulator CheB
LVVDDSAVIRRLVVYALESDPSFEVVGVAANGAMALSRIAQLKPDVITLDIEMPAMDGLETLRRLRTENKAVRVVMFSTLTARGAQATLEALALGADDYVTKAANTGSLKVSLNNLQQELIPKIKQLFFDVASPACPAASASAKSAAGAKVQVEAVAIGVSTGGPAALAAILPALPADFPVPVLVVQHMPPLFTRFLAESLNLKTPLEAREAVHGEILRPGVVYIAPGDFHMRVRRGGTGVAISLDQEQPQNSCRPAVDALFSSVAETYGEAAIGAVLTGMGQDGLAGARQLKACGACVLAQDADSSVVWGMPGVVAGAGLADEVLPLESVVPAILRRMGR